MHCYVSPIQLTLGRADQSPTSPPCRRFWKG